VVIGVHWESTGAGLPVAGLRAKSLPKDRITRRSIAAGRCGRFSATPTGRIPLALDMEPETG
jgi:hypothetical protein